MKNKLRNFLDFKLGFNTAVCINVLANPYAFPLYELYNDLKSLTLNTFLKTYYIALDKDDPLLYGNITDNQQVIQQMEDLFTQIIDNMKKLIFILKINQYHHELDIPAKINIIYNFLYEKIVLLAHKFKIKLSTERSL